MLSDENAVLRPPTEWYPRKAAPGSQTVPRPLLGSCLLRFVPGDARGQSRPVTLANPVGKVLAVSLTRKTGTGADKEVAVCVGVDGALRGDYWIDFVCQEGTTFLTHKINPIVTNSIGIGHVFARVYSLPDKNEGSPSSDTSCAEGELDLTNAELLGSGWVMERELKDEIRGAVSIPLQASTCFGGLVGEVTFEFLRVPSFVSGRVSDEPVMNKPPLFAGHRGCGAHTRHVVENTMGSFKLISESQDAHHVRCVELDVQLSSDGVPVVFHDFIFPTVSGHCLFLYNLPAKEIALLERRAPEREQPFSEYHIPTLTEVLAKLPSDVGLYLEVKYPPPNVQKSRRIPYPDPNLLVDQTLHSLMNASPGVPADRPIAILSYDADICTMFSLKQTKFPVFLLHCERRDGYDECDDADPRTVCVERGVEYAASQNFAGVVLFSEMVLEDESLAKRAASHGLSVLSYGPDNSDPGLVHHQIQDLGIDGVIADDICTVAEAVSPKLS